MARQTSQSVSHRRIDWKIKMEERASRTNAHPSDSILAYRLLAGTLDLYPLARKGECSVPMMRFAFLIERRNAKAFTSAHPLGRGFCFGSFVAGGFGL